MYKCKECGCEYNVKPDFCDCGNDEFECVNDTKDSDNITKTQKSDEFQINEKTNEVKKEPVSERNISPRAENPIFAYCKNNLNPFAVLIFLSCILMSIIVIFFLWNPKDNICSNDINNNIGREEKNINMPSIDSFWDNSIPAVKKVSETVQQTETVQEPQNILTVIPSKKTIQTQKPVTTTKQTAKTTQKQTSQKVVQNKTQTTKQKVQTANQMSQRTVSTANVQKSSQTANVTETKPVTTVVQLPVKPTKEQLQEFDSYKAKLRNLIGHKIDFTKVVGDGTCSVTFKINDTGKLISRSFSRQSTNITLNDAVYKAVMSTPTFNPPPEIYQNEFLTITIKFYDGNYEITLK